MAASRGSGHVWRSGSGHLLRTHGLMGLRTHSLTERGDNTASVQPGQLDLVQVLRPVSHSQAWPFLCAADPAGTHLRSETVCLWMLNLHRLEARGVSCAVGSQSGVAWNVTAIGERRWEGVQRHTLQPTKTAPVSPFYKAAVSQRTRSTASQSSLYPCELSRARTACAACRWLHALGCRRSCTKVEGQGRQVQAYHRGWRGPRKGDWRGGGYRMGPWGAPKSIHVAENGYGGRGLVHRFQWLLLCLPQAAAAGRTVRTGVSSSDNGYVAFRALPQCRQAPAAVRVDVHGSQSDCIVDYRRAKGHDMQRWH